MIPNRFLPDVSPLLWPLVLGAMLLFIPSLQVRAQSSCLLYDIDGSNVRYLRFQGNFARGNVNWYTSSGCDTAGGRLNLPGDGVAASSSQSGALAICDANLSGRNTVTRDTGAVTSNFWVCANHSRGRSSGGGDDDDDDDDEKKPSRPYIPTGITLSQTGLRLSAVDGFHSGIQFQRVGHDGVGIPSVIALGLLDAVDVWGTVGGGYEVCFPQAGQILFLDAATSPRAVSEIAHYTDGDFTCAKGDRAGTLVLVAGIAPPAIADDPPATAETPAETATIKASILSADHSTEISLADCQIITRYSMHHRASPAGKSKGLVPGDTLLTATARTAEWFYAAYQGRDGWLNMPYLAYFGACGYPGDEVEAEESG